MLDKMKGMYDFQKQAKAIQKDLKKKSFTATSSTGSFTAIVDGMQQLTSVDFNDDPRTFENLEKLKKDIVDVVNKAIDKSQKASASQMRGLMGGMNFPGM
jgi:DNA-binding protein YbaB